MAEPIRVTVRRGGDRRVGPPRPRGRRSRRRGRRVGRRSGARHLHALRGEADPGPAARARARGPRRARPRDRLAPRTSPTRRSSRRSQALLAKAPADRGRPRVRPVRGLEAQAQLLGQARGDARALPRATAGRYEGYRLADHPCQQAMLAEVASLAGTDRDRDRGRRLRRRHLRAPAPADGDRLRAESTSGSRPGDARLPRADPRPAGSRHDAHAGLRRLVREGRGRGAALRSVPRRASARAQGRGRQSARAPARPSVRSWTRSVWTGPLFGPTPLRNSRDEVVGEVKVS